MNLIYERYEQSPIDSTKKTRQQILSPKLVKISQKEG